MGNRRILQLTVPALGVLAAEPLYVLVDTAVVGHLGAVPLAGLALGGAVLSVVAGLSNFLAYGTTGRAARSFGAGRRADAVDEGVQASWLAAVIALVVVLALEAAAGPLMRLLAGGSTTVQHAAEQWLRVALLGVPGVLLALAGNGWLRGVQDVRRPLGYVLGANLTSAALSPLLVYGLRLGLVGSAVANVVAQLAAAAFFVRALLKERLALRPRVGRLRGQLAVARDLVVRTASLYAAFLAAAAVAARMGAAVVAAHQIALQLWVFLALVLDAYAVAAQALVGESLGAGRRDVARSIAVRVGRLGGWTGLAFALLLLAGWAAVPALFTGDPAVRHQAHLAWPWFAGMQPLAGVVFALDGALIGAGDVGFLRTITIVAALGGFLPMTLLAYALRLGLSGVWAGLTLLVAVRLVGMVSRVRGDRWLVAGSAP